MTDNTPSIQEIEGRNIDPELGSGEPAVVNDNSQLLNVLNQNAQFKAANDWRKYQQFLGDYEQKLKTQQDIADLPVADSDRDWLKKESVSLFKDALSDPYKIYSPEFNSKLAGIKANAVSSKQARDFAEKNAQWIAIHPEFNTDENKAKISDFIDGQTVEKGGRKFFTLDAPDVFDMKNYFKDIFEDPRVKSMENVNWVDNDKALRYDRADTKFLREPFMNISESSYELVPQIKKRADKMYSELPDNLKQSIGSPKKLWTELASKYFGSDKDIVRQGKLNVDAYGAPIQKAQLAAQIADDKRKNALGWAKLNLDAKEFEAKINEAKDKLKKTGVAELPFTPLPSILTNIGSYNKKVPLSSLPISMVAAIAPNLIDEKGQLKSKNENGKKTTEIQISVGKDKDGYENVFVYNDGNKEKITPTINESQLKSNAESWLATTAKERKGQEVYGYIDELYQNAKGTEKKASSAPSIEVKEDALIFNGNKYTLKEVQDAGYKDFEDFKKNN